MVRQAYRTKAGPRETAGKIIGGIGGGLLGAALGGGAPGAIAGGILGGGILGYAGSVLDDPIKVPLEQMLVEDPEFRDAYYENEYFLEDIDRMLKDPLWDDLLAKKSNINCP